MRIYALIVSILLSASAAYAQDEYALTNTQCFGNTGTDHIEFQYQTPDGGAIALIFVQHPHGYFESSKDSTWWLVKFDDQLNLTKKVFLEKPTSYDIAFGLPYKINTTSNTMVCAMTSETDSGNMSTTYLDSLLIFNLNLDLLSSVKINQKINFSIGINNNKDGGYCVFYNMWNAYYAPDSMAIVVINPDASVRLRKFIRYASIDSLKYMVTDTGDIFPAWLKHMVADSNYIYTISLVDYFEPTSSQKLAWIGITLDSNLQVVHTKVIENKYEGSTTWEELYQLNDSTLFFADNPDFSYNMRLYFMDTRYDTIAPKYITPDTHYYNEILNNQIYYYKGNEPFNNQINNQLLYVPYFHKRSDCPPDTIFCYSTTSILCFNFDGYLDHEIKLDSIPRGGQQTILYYRILSDGSVVVLTENIPAEGVDYVVSKFDKNGNHLWSYTLPREKKWKNALLNRADYLSLEPQIVSITSKERFIHVFREYKTTLFIPNDTIQLWDFTLNLENGVLIDSSIISTLVLQNLSNIAHSWGRIKRISDDKFSLVGESDVLCSGNGIDVFTSTASKNFNTILSHVFLDLNGNNILDSNEHYLTNVSMLVSNSNNSFVSYYNENEFIVNYTDTGRFIVKPNFSINYFHAFPDSFIINHSTYGNIDSIQFALQPIAVVNDLMVQLSNNGRGRPGFFGSYILNATNNGTVVQDATVKLKLDPRIDSIYTSLPAVMNDDTLSWTFDQVDPGDQKTVQLYFHYQPPPVSNIGDTLISVAVIYPITGDSIPDNNITTLYDVLRGSYDPNDKLCDKTEYTPEDFTNGNYIQYTIRFENTGNDTAFNILISDALDANLDVSIFVPLQGEFLYTAKITQEHIVTFSFDPIYLPPHHTSSVSYLIKPKNVIANSFSISNKAGVRFDYNIPVETNTVTTQVVRPTAVIQTISHQIRVYPNPTQNSLFIEATDIGISNIKVTDMNGRIMDNFSVSKEGKLSLDLNAYAAGAYLLYITTSDKLVKAVKISIVK